VNQNFKGDKMLDLNKEVKNKINELIDEDFDTRLEAKIKSINESLTKEEIKEIIKELLPDVDEMISKKVKEHFSFLIKTMQTIFSSNEEGE